MLLIRTAQHIATGRTLPSFRACRTLSLGDRARPGDRGRQVQSHTRVLTQEARRQWLQEQWLQAQRSRRR